MGKEVGHLCRGHRFSQRGQMCLLIVFINHKNLLNGAPEVQEASSIGHIRFIT